MLTQSELKALLDYNPDTGVFTWKVASNNRIHIGQVAGSLGPCGYIRVFVARKSYKAHRLAFLWMLGALPEHDVDHINGVRNDNRWRNLRPSSRSQNVHNIGGPRSDNASGYLGAHWSDSKGGWIAQIQLAAKVLYLGKFATPEQAHAAYLKAKHELHPTHKRLR